jgi:sigma-B regulation protein RsbU (phosphoserine phosphatase)
MRKQVELVGGQALGGGISVDPEPTPSDKAPGRSSMALETSPATSEAAQILVEHLFAQSDVSLPGISYAVTYRLAEGHAGGDIIDVYHFDNDSVAISIADISGKGTQAAVHAALIKYGLRAYSSHGLSPEKAVRALDRLYLENNAFERTESFASIFLGVVDPSRRIMTYTCAAHEPVFVMAADGSVRVLDPTAPLIGVFDDQHHLFKQHFVDLSSSSLFIGTTDGITEARNANGELYGMERLIAIVRRHRTEQLEKIVDAILRDALGFCGGVRRDDIAIIAARFE